MFPKRFNLGVSCPSQPKMSLFWGRHKFYTGFDNENLQTRFRLVKVHASACPIRSEPRKTLFGQEKELGVASRSTALHAAKLPRLPATPSHMSHGQNSLKPSDPLTKILQIHVYIYICIHTHMCTHMCIYIYT